LNPIARQNGWMTQYPLGNARPDYHRVVNTQHVFVDLTSPNEAGPFGSHITGKLNAASPAIRPPDWQAADITHSGVGPLAGGQHAVINYNGPVTQDHMYELQRYQNFCRNDAEWDETMNNVRMRYGNITTPTFTQTWDGAQRDAFVDAMRAPANPPRLGPTKMKLRERRHQRAWHPYSRLDFGQSEPQR
jgi:hypothetical protein